MMARIMRHMPRILMCMSTPTVLGGLFLATHGEPAIGTLSTYTGILLITTCWYMDRLGVWK